MALELAHIIHDPQGPETAPPLLMAHGLFGAARNLNSLGRRLATDRRVVIVDMRNHGASPWDDDVSYPAMAEDLAEAVRRHCGGRAVVLGHSMGGKAAMVLALDAPDAVAGLAAIDIAPVSYRHSHDGPLAAMRAVDLSAVRRRSDADPALAAGVEDAGLRAFLLQNLVIEGGAARWRVNLAALGAGMTVLTGFPDLAPDARYDGPALLLHGGASDYVGAEARPVIRRLFPVAEMIAVPGAGHWLHAERPDEFVAEVSGWLARI